jgi:hypothetical protein
MMAACYTSVAPKGGTQMARLSYMQRRPSGIYEYRKRLPTELAGQPPPDRVRAAFPELVNPNTGHFKGELVRSLGTHDPKEAKRLNLQHANEVQRLFDAALAAMKALAKPASLALPPHREITGDDLAAIEAETMAELLARDEEERTEGDDRRRLQSREERAQWPDLVPIAEPWAKGMAEDHAHVYGIEIEEMAGEFREAYARRDPGIVRRRRSQPFAATKSPSIIHRSRITKQACGAQGARESV